MVQRVPNKRIPPTNACMVLFIYVCATDCFLIFKYCVRLRASVLDGTQHMKFEDWASSSCIHTSLSMCSFSVLSSRSTTAARTSNPDTCGSTLSIGCSQWWAISLEGVRGLSGLHFSRDDFFKFFAKCNRFSRTRKVPFSVLHTGVYIEIRLLICLLGSHLSKCGVFTW